MSSWESNVVEHVGRTCRRDADSTFTQLPRLDLTSSRGVPSGCGGPRPTGALAPLNSQNKPELISVESVFLRKQRIFQTNIFWRQCDFQRFHFYLQTESSLLRQWIHFSVY